MGQQDGPGPCHSRVRRRPRNKKAFIDGPWFDGRYPQFPGQATVVPGRLHGQAREAGEDAVEIPFGATVQQAQGPGIRQVRQGQNLGRPPADAGGAGDGGLAQALGSGAASSGHFRPLLAGQGGPGRN